MNIFFIIGNKAITPGLESGPILAVVTRNTAIILLKEMGLEVEERDLSIFEAMESYENGELKEIFGTGTAATISLIKELRYQEFSMHFDVENWQVAPSIKERMDSIKYSLAEDVYHWMQKV